MVLKWPTTFHFESKSEKTLFCLNAKQKFFLQLTKTTLLKTIDKYWHIKKFWNKMVNFYFYSLFTCIIVQFNLKKTLFANRPTTLEYYTFFLFKVTMTFTVIFTSNFILYAPTVPYKCSTILNKNERTKNIKEHHNKL